MLMQLILKRKYHAIVSINHPHLLERRATPLVRFGAWPCSLFLTRPHLDVIVENDPLIENRNAAVTPEKIQETADQRMEYLGQSLEGPLSVVADALDVVGAGSAEEKKTLLLGSDSRAARRAISS
jgi:hypothetical protein